MTDKPVAAAMPQAAPMPRALARAKAKVPIAYTPPAPVVRPEEWPAPREQILYGPGSPPPSPAREFERLAS